MAAVGGNNIVWYTYTGAIGEVIPWNATHVIVEARIILRDAFREHENIVEVVCHGDVEKIEQMAFYYCPNLRRVIMPGVKIVERGAFLCCHALTDVECGKLEMIGASAFCQCRSLRSINLLSVRIVERHAFENCRELVHVKFGNKMERIDRKTFYKCSSIERITIPLKDGIITVDDTFMECDNLRHVDLIKGELHETIAALHSEDWINDMNQEIDSINQILPNSRAGISIQNDEKEKGQAVREWIRSVLGKMVLYQAEHQLVMNEASSTLHHALPQDIVNRSVLSFLKLPSYTFELGDDEDDDNDDDNDDDMPWEEDEEVDYDDEDYSILREEDDELEGY